MENFISKIKNSDLMSNTHRPRFMSKEKVIEESIRLHRLCVSKKLNSFGSIYVFVKKNMGKGFGPLFAYDFAAVNHKPTFVPLKDRGVMNGSVIGYKNLCDFLNFQPVLDRYLIDKTHFPSICDGVPLDTLESLFCVYKDDVSKMISEIKKHKSKSYKCNKSLTYGCK